MSIEPRSGLSIAHYLETAIPWQANTFGPGARHQGLVAHIGRELREVDAAATMNAGDDGVLGELVDVAILALDGAWRAIMGDAFDQDRVKAVAADLEELVLDGLLDGASDLAYRPPCTDVLNRRLDRLDTLDTFPGAAERFARLAGAALAQAVALVAGEVEHPWAIVRDRLFAKLRRNLARSWPDWRTIPQDQPIEHIREAVR